MQQGKIPYIDFKGGSKPPLYEYMLYLIGVFFGTGVKQFRTFFSFFDAVVTVCIFLVGKKYYNEGIGLKAALVYAICPLNIITIGLSGHYEPVIIFFILGAFLFLHKEQFQFSALFLGTAFALKIFPIVLLPFFLSTIKTWKLKIVYVILFIIPMAVSFIPLLIISPEAIMYYLREEGNWGGWLGFSSMFSSFTNVTRFNGIRVTWIFMGIFLFLVFILFLSWIRTKEKQIHTIRWFKIIIYIHIIYYSLFIPMWFIYYKTQIDSAYFVAMVILIEVVILSIAFFLVNKYLPRILPKKIHESDNLILTGAFAIMFFIFGLPNFAPWYLLWFLPLVFIIKTNRLKLTILWLVFWHSIGVAVSLLPGLPPIN
jgi:hypothetical protein